MTLSLLLVYGDLDALTNALTEDEVEGILLDVYTASYSINQVWNKNSVTKRFDQVKILHFPFFIGFFVQNFGGNSHLNGCIKSKSLQFADEDIYPIADNYIQRIRQVNAFNDKSINHSIWVSVYFAHNRLVADTIQIEFESVDFWGEGIAGEPGEKLLEARTKTNNKHNPHRMPGIEPREPFS